MIDKPVNNRAWFFVAPVLAFVLLSSIIPMMTVVNYSVQDTMGANSFFWNGDQWFRDLLNPTTAIGARFNDALFRTLAFSLVIWNGPQPLPPLAIRPSTSSTATSSDGVGCGRGSPPGSVSKQPLFQSESHLSNGNSQTPPVYGATSPHRVTLSSPTSTI